MKAVVSKRELMRKKEAVLLRMQNNRYDKKKCSRRMGDIFLRKFWLSVRRLVVRAWCYPR